MSKSIRMPLREFSRRMEYAAWEQGEDVEWIDEVWDLIDRSEHQFDGFQKYKMGLEPVSKGKWSIERHDIPRRCYERLFHVIQDDGINLARDTGYGDTTLIKEDGRVWMSDTWAEIGEHSNWINKLWWCESLRPRVIINGLGIGLAVNIALKHKARWIDVVEKDKDVIDLVSPSFIGKPVRIHHADAFDMTWPHGTGWDLAWHDIWQTIGSANLSEMDRLQNKYKHRVAWQASWQRKGCLRMRRNERDLKAALERQDWDTVKRLDPEF